MRFQFLLSVIRSLIIIVTTLLLYSTYLQLYCFSPVPKRFTILFIYLPYDFRSRNKTKQNKQKMTKKLIRMIMEAIIVTIIVTTMKIGNNCKLGHAEKKENKQLVRVNTIILIVIIIIRLLITERRN